MGREGRRRAETYKVGLSGLGELLLGIGTDRGVCSQQSVADVWVEVPGSAQRTWRQRPLKHLVDVHAGALRLELGGSLGMEGGLEC